MDEKLPARDRLGHRLPLVLHRQGPFGRRRSPHGLTERVAITWLPYELNPEMPPRRAWTGPQYLESKFGPASAGRSRAGSREAALESGVTFNWTRVTRSVNTRAMAHVCWSPAASTVQRAAASAMTRPALFKAYWQDGRDIGDLETLVQIAGRA